MIIRKTEPRDLDRIAAIFDEARTAIAALGIDQWQDGYPNRQSAEEDCLSGRGWVICGDGGEVLGVCALIDDGEETYDRIEGGEWLTGNDNRSYLAVHRVAVSSDARRTGAASELMKFAAEFARDAGLGSVRIDTHRGNAVMRRMLEKNGFVPCGIIHLKNGDPRVAYEKRNGSADKRTEEAHETDSL